MDALVIIGSVIVLVLAALACWILRNRTAAAQAPRTMVWASDGTVPKREANQTGGAIPKIIWTYWHSPELPMVVARCVANWRRHNPHYQIHVLHAGNLNDYLDDVPAQLRQVGIPKQTDWIRLALLHRHGGIWLDASIFLTEPLDWVMQSQIESGSEFVGFYLDGYTTKPEFPVVESWFLAAPAGGAFIGKWLDLFRSSAIEADTFAYLDGLKRAGVYADYSQKIGDPAYHTIHVVAQQVMQSTAAEPVECGDGYRLFLACAETSAYAYHVQSGWRRRRLYVRLLWNAQRVDKPMLIKLRGGERKKLEPYLRRGWYRRRSLAGQQLEG